MPYPPFLHFETLASSHFQAPLNRNITPLFSGVPHPQFCFFSIVNFLAIHTKMLPIRISIKGRRTSLTFYLWLRWSTLRYIHLAFLPIRGFQSFIHGQYTFFKIFAAWQFFMISKKYTNTILTTAIIILGEIACTITFYDSFNPVYIFHLYIEVVEFSFNPTSALNFCISIFGDSTKGSNDNNVSWEQISLSLTITSARPTKSVGKFLVNFAATSL